MISIAINLGSLLLSTKWSPPIINHRDSFTANTFIVLKTKVPVTPSWILVISVPCVCHFPIMAPFSFATAEPLLFTLSILLLLLLYVYMFRLFSICFSVLVPSFVWTWWLCIFSLHYYFTDIQLQPVSTLPKLIYLFHHIILQLCHALGRFDSVSFSLFLCFSTRVRYRPRTSALCFGPVIYLIICYGAMYTVVF